MMTDEDSVTTFDGTGTPPEGLKNVMAEFFEKRLDKTVDWSVCNITDEETKAKMLETEAKRVLLVMGTIKNRDKGFAKVFYVKDGEDVKVSSLGVVWPNGAQLLRTHSDVIYCGSLSVTSKDPHVLMLICAIDSNNDMRLAAFGITRNDNQGFWSSLFK